MRGWLCASVLILTTVASGCAQLPAPLWGRQANRPSRRPTRKTPAPVIREASLPDHDVDLSEADLPEAGMSDTKPPSAARPKTREELLAQYRAMMGLSSSAADPKVPGSRAGRESIASAKQRSHSQAPAAWRSLASDGRRPSPSDAPTEPSFNERSSTEPRGAVEPASYLAHGPASPFVRSTNDEPLERRARLPSLSDRVESEPYRGRPSTRYGHPPDDKRGTARSRISDRDAPPYAAADHRETVDEISWSDHLGRAIRTLEKRLQTPGLDESEQILGSSQLRLLYLLADRQEDATAAVMSLPTHEQEFLREQLFGLGIFLDRATNPTPSKRAVMVLQRTRQANAALAGAGTLQVGKATFCQSIDGYGQYEPFAVAAFTAEQEVLLYAELENFHVAGEPGAYETEFHGSYEILDADGRSLLDFKLPEDKQRCRNRRRDYYLAYRLYMPTLPAGKYQLQLTVKDVKGGKFGRSIADFQIAP